MTSRVKIGWIKFRECEELLRGRRLSLRKEWFITVAYNQQCYIYGSETWSLRESEMAILRTSERVMVRSEISVVKLVNEISE